MVYSWFIFDLGEKMIKPKFRVGSNVYADWINKGKKVPVHIKARFEEQRKWFYLIYTLDNQDHIIVTERYLSNG